MTVTLPAGYEPPANVKPGEPFEVVATLSQNEDGTYELTAIDDMEIGESEDDDDMAEQMPWNQGDPFAEPTLE